MKKLNQKVWMSNETSTAEERLEIFKLAKELGYNVWEDSCISLQNTFLTYNHLDKDFALYGSPNHESDVESLTYGQILEILANNEDDHSAIYKALGRVRSGHHLPEVGKTIEPTIQEATEILHAACKRAGIVVKTLLFEMP